MKKQTKFFFYTLISGFALFIDYTLYFILLNIDLSTPEIAASVTYFFGLFVAYFLLKKYVFNFKNKLNLFQEKIRFLISGSIGIFTTYISVKLFMTFFPLPIIAKAFAAILSFFVVYLFRTFLVFIKK